MLPVSKTPPVTLDGADRTLREVEASQARARTEHGSERVRRAREAAHMLEGMFFRQLVKELRRTVPDGGLFGGGVDQQIFSEMFDGAVADEAGKSGSLGLADALQQHFLAQIDGGQQRHETELPPASRVGEAERTRALRVGEAERTTAVQRTGRGLSAASAKQPYRFEPPRRPEAVTLQDADGCFCSPLTGAQSRVDAERGVEAQPGDAVVASASGTVVSAGDDYLIVEHGSGVYSRYAQLGQTLAQPGDLVLRGQTIGQVGPAGRFGFDIRRQEQILSSAEINALLDRGVREKH